MTTLEFIMLSIMPVDRHNNESSHIQLEICHFQLTKLTSFCCSKEEMILKDKTTELQMKNNVTIAGVMLLT